jgi:hypothetical protein
MKSLFKFPRLVVTVLAAVATIHGSLVARSQAAPSTTASDQPRALFITIIEGEGALNDIRARTAREPIVEVDDENHKPVAGALVLFAIDSNGAGGAPASFSGLQSLAVQTNEEGRAVAHGFRVTQATGQFHIKVRASKGQALAEASILQTNVAVLLSPTGVENGAEGGSGNGTEGGAGHKVGIFGHKKVDVLLASAIVVGVVAGLLIANSGSTTAITPGTGTVGAPAATAGVRIQFHRHGP